MFLLYICPLILEIIKNLNIMRVVNTFFKYLTVVAIFIATSAVNAQTINEVKQAWNDGLAAKEAGNYEEAITLLESCIDMCVTLVDEEENEEAEDLLYNAEDLLPQVKYQIAKDAFEAKEINKSAELFKESLKSGESYGNQTIIDNSKKYLTQIYYVKGGKKYKAKDFEGAIAEFDKALQYDPNFAKAYYWKMAIAKNNNEREKVKEFADKGLAASTASKDRKTSEKIKGSASAYFLNAGIDAKKAAKYNDAVANFEQAVEYDNESANAYYYMAAVKNEMKDWSGAVEAASKAVEIETSPAENAKMYYELGTAYAGKNDNSNACNAFKKAAVGQYAEAANYQLGQLGCN